MFPPRTLRWCGVSKAAGAVLLGKLNLHEFAYGGSGIISHYGMARNPWNGAHVTGGSSSGAAAAVAAGLCYGAIGTDTAGSIRLPAACCGITGLKPTYGLVSTRGIIPLSWTMDHVGPMARTAADCALMLQAIAHYDAHDINCRRFPPVFYPSAIEESVANLRIGAARDFWNDIDDVTRKSVDAAVGAITKLVAQVKEINLSIDADRDLVRGEAFAYHQKYLPQHKSEYDPETLRRIRGGADVTAPQYIQAHRGVLQRRREILSLFEQVDLVLTPTTPLLAPTLADLQSAPDQLRSKELLMLRNTRPFNVLGLPAISVCCGFSESGLPIGLQIAGGPGGDGAVLSLAHAFQKQTDWHKRRPPIAT